jgi:hypothetical protein
MKKRNVEKLEWPDLEIKEIIPKKKKNTPSTNDFFTQYKDPRWQKKRLKIMERDNFMCTSCQDDGNTLNVHHRVPYRKDTKPWEYEDDELTTLCEVCHEDITNIIKYCTQVIMGRCYCIDTAMETQRIMERLDGMNPWQLQSVWKMLDVLIKY